MAEQRYLVTGGSGFIGTHLVERLIKDNCSVLSIDINPPKIACHRSVWVSCNILNPGDLKKAFAQFEPTHVLHLAAKANLKGLTHDDFPENTMGTANVLRCVNETPSVERLVHFSTQYVVMPGLWPETDEFLMPYTAYGESKAEAEKIIRGECNKCSVILRPTNVWGPYHPFFPFELWKYLKLRLYVHPGYKPIIKYYSYVGNCVDQVMAITTNDSSSVCGKVFYISDPPIDNVQWMNAFSVLLSGHNVRKIPIPVWKLLAKFGDILIRLGIKFPMSSERLFRLTVNEQIPLERTIELVGVPKVSLEEGVQESVRWYLNKFSV